MTAPPALQALIDAAQGILNIVSESRGVAHLNGATVRWGYFPEVEALDTALSAAREALDQIEGAKQVVCTNLRVALAASDPGLAPPVSTAPVIRPGGPGGGPTPHAAAPALTNLLALLNADPPDTLAIGRAALMARGTLRRVGAEAPPSPAPGEEEIARALLPLVVQVSTSVEPEEDIAMAFARALLAAYRVEGR